MLTPTTLRGQFTQIKGQRVIHICIEQPIIVTSPHHNSFNTTTKLTNSFVGTDITMGLEQPMFLYLEIANRVLISSIIINNIYTLPYMKKLYTVLQPYTVLHLLSTKVMHVLSLPASAPNKITPFSGKEARMERHGKIFQMPPAPPTRSTPILTSPTTDLLSPPPMEPANRIAYT